MIDAIHNAILAHGADARCFFSPAGIPNPIMIGVALTMFWLAIRKEVESPLLLPIAFGGLLLGKIRCRLSGGRMNPRVGAAGISAYPMAARMVQAEGCATTTRITSSCTPWGLTPAAGSARSWPPPSCLPSSKAWT